MSLPHAVKEKQAALITSFRFHISQSRSKCHGATETTENESLFVCAGENMINFQHDADVCSAQSQTDTVMLFLWDTQRHKVASLSLSQWRRVLLCFVLFGEILFYCVTSNGCFVLSHYVSRDMSETIPPLVWWIQTDKIISFHLSSSSHHAALFQVIKSHSLIT